jgi:hypothetical protein
LAALFTILNRTLPILYLESDSLLDSYSSERQLKKNLKRVMAQGQPMSPEQFILQMRGVIYKEVLGEREGEREREREGEGVSLNDFSCLKSLGDGSVSRAILAEHKRSMKLYVIKSVMKF